MAETDLDLFITGGTVVAPQGVAPANVGVRDGKIAVVCDPSVRLAARRTVDATGRHVLPGVIDPHVHLRARGQTVAEACRTETPSMALGGVTTIFHFSQALDSYLPVWEQERAEVNENALIDVGFHSIVMTEQHIAELPLYAREFGVTTCKLYMAAQGKEMFPGTRSVNDGLLLQAFETIGQLSRGAYPRALAMVHAENSEIAWALTERFKKEGRDGIAAWSEARPWYIYEEPMRRAIFYARQHACPLYIVHCGIGSTRALIAEARGVGDRVYAETCPLYLTYHYEHERAVEALNTPAVQGPQDLEGLWAGLLDGAISTVGSDHLPRRATDRDSTGKTIWTMRGGSNGSGTILPVVLTYGHHQRGMSLERVVEVTSTNAAKLLGLFPRKGTIQVGADADLVIVDLEREVRLQPEMLQLDWVLHKDWDFKGWPVMTLVRGQVVAEDGQIVAEPGTGRYVRDAASTAERAGALG